MPTSNRPGPGKGRYPRPIPAWHGAFLAALERTGSVASAAAVAGVSARGARASRGRHADFARAWGLALGACRAARAAGMMRAALAAPSQIRAGTAGITDSKLERVPSVAIGEDAEQAFLDMLAATANVKRSAAAAGVSAAAMYARRRRYADFREAWDTALEAGLARLESLIIEAAVARFERAEETMPADGDAERAGTVSVTTDEALRLIALRMADRRQAERGFGRGGRPGRGRMAPPVASHDEIIAALTTRLKMFAIREGYGGERALRQGSGQAVRGEGG